MAITGERWKTVRWAAQRAASWTTWTPLAPVPITPTRRPSSTTPSAGHIAVWCQSPANVSKPGRSGTYGLEPNPVHSRRYWARYERVSASTVHRAALGSNVAALARVP